MKGTILFFTLVIAVMFTTICTAQSAEAEGGCTEVTVVSTPSYSPNIYFTGVGWKQCGNWQPCCRVITSGDSATPRFYLEKKDDDNNWASVAGPQFSPVFNDLDKGIYRVRMHIPEVLYNSCEGGEAILLYNTLGQFVGYWGTWSDPFFTNEVLVGEATPDDIGFAFVDAGENPGNALFDMDEEVVIDVSASKNYNLWYLSVTETKSPYRWKTMGWNHGAVPNNGVLNLTDVWDPSAFYPIPNSYQIAFVVENNECKTANSWNVLDPKPEFFICPEGVTGCRLGIDEREIAISPNPATSAIKLQHFIPDPGWDYRLTITDIAGKVVKDMSLKTNELDISNLQNGMFVVRILKEKEQVFTSKLIVNK